MALTPMEQQHLNQLEEVLRTDPNNQQAFKWALKANLLRRYAVDPNRDPESWPKTKSLLGGNPRRDEEFRDWLRIEQSFPPYCVTWFTWAEDRTATMRHVFGFTSLHGWSWMDRARSTPTGDVMVAELHKRQKVVWKRVFRLNSSPGTE